MQINNELIYCEEDGVHVDLVNIGMGQINVFLSFADGTQIRRRYFFREEETIWEKEVNFGK